MRLVRPSGSNSEARQFARCSFHRQPDHIGTRTINAADDSAARALRGIGAGLVERPHLREIAVEFSFVEPFEVNAACFPEDADRAFSQAGDEHA